MLLRRVIEHVKAQNWTAVGLDFVIVVTGVFMGLQVNNWNEAREDRIDERLILGRLHSDIETAEALSMRVRDRRLQRWRDMHAVSDAIFRDPERKMLTEDECFTLLSLSVFNVSLSDLPSLVELIGSGRVSILRDKELRAALVALRQMRENLSHYISIQNTRASLIPTKYPGMVTLESLFNEELGEVGYRATCNLEAMQTSQPFLNDYSVNADMYDAYMRDAFSPWNDKFREAHALLDRALNIQHDEGPVP